MHILNYGMVFKSLNYLRSVDVDEQKIGNSYFCENFVFSVAKNPQAQVL